MKHQSFESFPAEWVQLAQPSPWRGVQVNRLIATSHEGEFFTTTAIVSLIKRAAQQYESNSGSSRWSELDIRSGSICWLPCDYGARNRWEGNTDAINLYIDMNWFRELQGSSSEDLPLLKAPMYGLSDKVTASLIDDIYKDNQLGAPAGLAYSESLVIAALHRLNAMTLTKRAMNKGDKDHQIIAKAFDYIHGNLDNSLTIGDVAQGVGFDRGLFAFVRLFKKHSGKTPHQYILDVRLEKAKELLAKGGHTVTDVAMSCGFNNLSHFSDTFKQRWGVPPSSLMPQRGRPYAWVRDI